MFTFVICDPIAGCRLSPVWRWEECADSAGVGRGTSGRPKHQKTLARSQCRLGHLARARTQHFSLSLGWITTTIYSLRPNIHYSLTIWTLYICQCKIEEAKESASEDYSLSCIELLTLLIWNVRLMFNKFNSSLSSSPRLYFNSASTLYYRKACHWEVLLVGYITI